MKEPIFDSSEWFRSGQWKEGERRLRCLKCQRIFSSPEEKSDWHCDPAEGGCGNLRSQGLEFFEVVPWWEGRRVRRDVGMRGCPFKAYDDVVIISEAVVQQVFIRENLKGNHISRENAVAYLRRLAEEKYGAELKVVPTECSGD